MQRIDARVEYLMRLINEKTENMKGVFGLQDKVRQEMVNKNQKKKITAISRTIFDGLDR